VYRNVVSTSINYAVTIMKKTTIRLLVGAILLGGTPSLLHAETIKAPLWPNAGSNSILVPSGWGASAGMVFFGIGTTTPQVYSDRSDGDSGAGFGLGNPSKNLGLELSVAMMDLSKRDNFSFGFKVHRIIADGTSIGIGGMNLFHDKLKSDADDSYYVVVSHSMQNLQTESNPYESKLQFNLGVGRGMFSTMSPYDVAAGKGKHGTYIFGSTAYEIFKATNAIVEWSGMNLNAGVSTGLFSISDHIPVTATVAAGDLTRYTGDGKVRLYCSLSAAVLF
jgi:hypothetical protein